MIMTTTMTIGQRITGALYNESRFGGSTTLEPASGRCTLRSGDEMIIHPRQLVVGRILNKPLLLRCDSFPY